MSGIDNPSPPMIRFIAGNGENTPPKPDLRYLEPLFRLGYQGRLRVETQGWNERAKAYFAHAVARTPQALWLHVQRIGLYAETRDPDIYGALADLFLVLGDNGLPLRRRMLALGHALLTPEQRQDLSEQLENPGREQQHPEARGSVLSRGICGCRRLIERDGRQEARRDDPLETARQLIEYGQLEPAQETLESALLAEPGRMELHHALLEIYRHLRLREPVEKMLRKLPADANPALTAWQDLLKQLTEGST